MNNKGADQTVRMRRLVCSFVVSKPPKKVFLRRGPIKKSLVMDSQIELSWQDTSFVYQQHVFYSNAATGNDSYFVCLV